MQKRTVAQILILLLILPIGLTTGYLKWQQRIVKKDVKSNLLSRLDSDELTQFRFRTQTVSSLNWKDKHEFSYCGEMYDIVCIDTLKDSLVFWCWHDIKESKIEQQLSYLKKAAFFSKPNSQKASHQLWNYLLTLFIVYPETEGPLKHIYCHNLMTQKGIYLAQIYLANPSPPPRIC